MPARKKPPKPKPIKITMAGGDVILSASSPVAYVKSPKPKPIRITMAGGDVILSTSAAVVYVGGLDEVPTFDSTIITFDSSEYTMDAA